MLGVKRLEKSKFELDERIEDVMQTLQEMPESLENELKSILNEINAKNYQMEEIQSQLETLNEYTELQKMGPGKSFGEKALITNSLRAANVICTKDCHFAVMAKNDYDKVLRKIELKTQNRMINFLQQIPYLKLWTRRMLLNFSYYLSTK